MNRVEGLILDLDGTLIDTYPDLEAAAMAAIAEAGLVAAQVPMAQVRQAASWGSRAMLTALGIGDDVVDDVRERMLDIYEDQVAVHSRPYPGVHEWIEAMPVMIATNKPTRFAVPLLQELMPALLDRLVTPDDAGASKPDPAMVHLAVQRLGLPADTLIFVGDDPKDLIAADAAGIRFLGVNYGYGDSDDWIDRTDVASIDEPDQLLPLLRSAGAL